MNGLHAPSLALVSELCKSLPDLHKRCHLALFPPATLLAPLGPLCRQYGVALGGQDCFYEEKGAFTGDISPIMLKDAGCRYVILGHSERRCYHQETSILVRKKAEAAHHAGLTTIICIGEMLEHKESGQTFTVVQEQLIESLPSTTTEGNTIIAYEPVWAIGTGKTPVAEDIEKTHDFIRHTALKQFEKTFRILYGGSVKAANAKEFMKLQHVSGLLVGGASLDKEEFLGIIKACGS